MNYFGILLLFPQVSFGISGLFNSSLTLRSSLEAEMLFGTQVLAAAGREVSLMNAEIIYPASNYITSANLLLDSKSHGHAKKQRCRKWVERPSLFKQSSDHLSEIICL